ncbi:hypothetical protein Tco_1303826 [Tanacetum coccineum]
MWAELVLLDVLILSFLHISLNYSPVSVENNINVMLDSEDVADKEGQHQMTENEQVLRAELRIMLLSSVSTATTPYVSAASTPTGANAGESSFVYLGGKIPIDASTLPNADLPIDPNMPDLEDDSDAFSNDGIFNGAYDDENFKLQKGGLLVYLTSGEKGGCQFLGRRLISWNARATIEAIRLLRPEYVTAANCVGKDCYEKRLIEVVKIHTDFNVADLLTKGFDVTRFNFLVRSFRLPVHAALQFTYALTVGNFTAIVAGKPVSISEASIRSDLQFNDAAGIDVLPNQAIFDTIQLMGGKKISRNVTPLFPSMLALNQTMDEGAVSRRPSGNPSPHLLLLTKRLWLESLEVSHPSDRSISEGNVDGLTLQSVFDPLLFPCVNRKPAKFEPTVHKDPAFDDLDDTIDYMETEDAHDEGTVKDSEETRILIDQELQLKGQSGRSLVSSAVYYEVTPPNTFPLRHIFGGVTEGVNEAERKFAQLANDEEIARKVQEEWEAEEEKKKLAEEEASKAAFTNEYDFIQARLNADKILAEKLQEEEREKFTIEQRAKFLHDTIAAQRRFLAQQRYEAIINKLPIRNQLKNQMMAYLKYVFEEHESTRVKAKIKEPKENIRKRSGRRLKMKAPKRSKRQKTDYDHEEENQLRTFLKIVLEEEEKIDYEVLGTRYPIINWESKFYNYGHFGRELIYYRVFRVDGSSRWIKTFSEMIKFFDRIDLVKIHSLVMKRFKTTPPEGIDLLLWGDLGIMFESKEDDKLWKNQEVWKLQS